MRLYITGPKKRIEAAHYRGAARATGTLWMARNQKYFSVCNALPPPFAVIV
jgi:hypothetical protein